MAGDVIEFERMGRFVGTWMNHPDNPSIEWDVHLSHGVFSVEGVDAEDGERFVVSDVRFDGRALRWSALMPSTNHITEHELTVREDGSAEHRCTLVETLHRDV